MNTRGVALLHRLVAMGSTSLLQYVNDAVPWSADADRAAFAKVQFLANEERDFVARLSRFLQKRHFGVPKIATYPSHFTTMNFVTIDYLLPKLIVEADRELTTIRAWLQGMDEDDARAQMQGYLDMKERHRHILQELASAKAGAAGAA
jgi:hypothetical protein